MFETLQSVLAFAITLITALSSATGFIVAMLKNSKNTHAKEIALKTNEILDMVKCKVMEVEIGFAVASDLQGLESLGEQKKKAVMQFIEGKCQEKGIDFDEDYWSAQVESIVKILNYNK